jgi:MoaD family protein
MAETILTIKLYAMLRDLAGGSTLDVAFTPGGTVRDLVAAIAAACPPLGAKMLNGEGELSGLVSVLVEGRNVEWLDGMDTVIHAGDEIALIPPAAGG